MGRKWAEVGLAQKWVGVGLVRHTSGTLLTQLPGRTEEVGSAESHHFMMSDYASERAKPLGQNQNPVVYQRFECGFRSMAITTPGILVVSLEPNIHSTTSKRNCEQLFHTAEPTPTKRASNELAIL